MYRIIDKRGTGKTSRLLLLAKETGATVVCANPGVMREKSYAYGLVGIDFISYADYMNRKNNDALNGKQFLIDEVDYFLGKDIIGYTLTDED